MGLSVASAEVRAANLRNPRLVGGVFLGALAIYVAGEFLSPFDYTDHRFVIDYFATELAVTAYLLLATVLLLPAPALGLQRPARVQWRYLLPFALWLPTALGAWWVTRQSVPAAAADTATGWYLLRTTLLVGVTEEWLYRGLVFAALARWLGLRRGAYVALLVFGAFHLINVAAGVPVKLALVQFVLATMTGSVLLLAAFATRSLWLPMLGHGLYDFAVIDMARLAAAGASQAPQAVMMAVALALAITSLVLIARLPGELPYVD